jgi:uncharacterized protein (TIGR00369 family)
MPDAAELERLLAAQTAPECAALTPFRIEAADFGSGQVRLRFAAQPAFRNHFGHVQGGFAVAMVDVLVALAGFSRTRLWLPTIEIRCSFLTPLPLDECVGEARPIRIGAQIGVFEATLSGMDGVLAVHATATVARPAR